MRYFKNKYFLFTSIIVALSTIIYAQSRGTPNQLRVITDANGALLASATAQVLPLSQPSLFSNTRLATDASGNLLVVLSGGTGVTSITGTANQIIASASTGAVTLSTPQDIATTSSPSFLSLGLGSVSAPYGINTLTSPQTAASNTFSLNIVKIAPPVSGPIATGSGSCTTGTHVGAVTGVTTEGTETLIGTSSASATCNGTNNFRLNIQIPVIGYVGEKMYISKAGTTTPLFLCVDQSASLTSQISCGTADGSLSSTQPPVTPPAAVSTLRWQQGVETSGAFSVGPPGLQLWPGQTGTSSDFTFSTNSNIPALLSLTNTTSSALRSFQAGNLYVGTSLANAGDKAHITSSEFFTLTTSNWGWCSSVTNSTCDTGLSRNAAGVVEFNNGTTGTFRDARGRHYLGGGVAPAVTNTTANSCGTTAASLVGSDIAGKVTVGATAGTSCTVTFTTAFTNPPACSASDESTAVLTRASSTTTTVILAGVFTAGDVVAYQCLGY